MKEGGREGEREGGGREGEGGSKEMLMVATTALGGPLRPLLPHEIVA